MGLNVGTTVIYGSNGICTIVDIRTETFEKTTREYFVLQPVGDEKTTFFIPTDSPPARRKIRRLLNPEKLHELLNNVKNTETYWIQNDRERNEYYRQTIRSGCCEDIIKMLRSIQAHKEELSDAGKKLHISDETAMQRAEDMVFEEFALVLNIDKEEVLPYIINQMDNQ